MRDIADGVRRRREKKVEFKTAGKWVEDEEDSRRLVTTAHGG